MSDLRKALERLIAAAEPFTREDVVDETAGTIPLTEELERAIAAAEEALKVEKE